MRVFKPKFWNSKFNIFSIILLPISLLFYILTKIRKVFLRPTEFKIPVICIGNIYLGGTGKTPFSIFCANELSAKGKRPVVIKKLYKNHFDENRFIQNYFKDLIVKKNRVEAIFEAEKQKFDSVILDDGFQDYKVKKDLNILCFHKNQLVGNGFIFPSGPLRESLNNIKNAEIVIINGGRSEMFEKKVFEINRDIDLFYSDYRPLNIESFKNKKILAFAGIGSPENFFKLLELNDIKIQKKISFPDHYNFKKREILEIIDYANKHDLEVLTTEKDYYRIKDYSVNNINYLKLKLEIKDRERLIQKILKVYDKKI